MEVGDEWCRFRPTGSCARVERKRRSSESESRMNADAVRNSWDCARHALGYFHRLGPMSYSMSRVFLIRLNHLPRPPFIYVSIFPVLFLFISHPHCFDTHSLAHSLTHTQAQYEQQVRMAVVMMMMMMDEIVNYPHQSRVHRLQARGSSSTDRDR